MSLTDDLVEWLVADQKVFQFDRLQFLNIRFDKVCEKWMSIATRLSLTQFIPNIASTDSRRKYQDDRSKLKMVIQVWRDKRPESYTLKGLKTTLAQEVRWCFMKQNVL